MKGMDSKACICKCAKLGPYTYGVPKNKIVCMGPHGQRQGATQHGSWISW